VKSPAPRRTHRGSGNGNLEAALTAPETPENRFRRLHDEHFEVVRRYARRRDPDIADDVAAETFAVAWRRLDDVPVDAGPWLIGVARNVRLNLRRSQRRQQTLVAELARAERASSVDEPLLTELPAVLAAALEALSPLDREVLLLHAWDDLDSPEIAVVVGCSKANASLRLHRAKRRFERALHALGAVPANVSRSTTTGEGAIDGC
jgi:RNA polymerase sigma-70 factor (ECF subfamily)